MALTFVLAGNPDSNFESLFLDFSKGLLIQSGVIPNKLAMVS